MVTRTGTAGNDTLTGTNGADILDGREGDDVLIGLRGGDTYIGGAGNDTAVVTGYVGGLDLDLSITGPQVSDGQTYVFDGIENIRLIISATSDYVSTNATLRGDDGDNVLEVDGGVSVAVWGGGGDDVLISGGRAAGPGPMSYSGTGLYGEAGDDWLMPVADEYETADGGEGSDTVEMSLGELRSFGSENSYIDLQEGYGFQLWWYNEDWEAADGYLLPSMVSVENLLIHTTGGTGILELYGSTAANRLEGRGGLDIMVGRGGDDTYVVDRTGDRVVEASGEGRDTVLTSVSFNGAGQSLEVFIAAGDQRLNMAGNDEANTMFGNDAVNGLSGGRGADIMEGLGGNDVYTVDDAGDRVIEAAGGGLDLVKSGVTYTLPDQVEKLTLITTRQINGIGNALDNTLIGNDRPNVLLGHGGRDLMTGGGGADRFDFRSVSDSPWAAFDRITDLEAHDVISLDRIDADTTRPGDQAFVLVAAFTKQAGQLTLTYSAAGGHTTLAADVNGDGIGDFRVILMGDHRDFDNFRL